MTHIDSSSTREGIPDVPNATLAALPSTGEAAGTAEPAESEGASPASEPARVREIGGRKDGPEPTRFGDWEKNGRCVDF
jgi:hypothetical protein